MPNDFGLTIIYQDPDGSGKGPVSAHWDAIPFIEIDGFRFPYCLYQWSVYE